MDGVQPYVTYIHTTSLFFLLITRRQSQACIPATLGLLSPFSDPMVCPSSAERFELRTRCLGCNVSALTALTAVVSVASTLLVVGAIYAVLKWRTQISALWCGGGGGGDAVVDETTGLLRGPREAAAGLGRRWSYWVYNTVPGDGDDRPGLERSDTSGEEGEAVGGREFEERRRRMLQRRVDEV